MWESVVVLLAAITALWQGAHSAKPAPASPPVSLTVAQVLALQPAELKAPIASLAGEHAAYTTAWAALQTYLATPFDPIADEGLPDALEAVPLYGWDASLVRARLLHALPALATKRVDYQRAVLTGAHTLFWQDAAAPLWGLLPQITTPKEFAIAAYTVLRASDTAPVRARLRAQMQANFGQWDQEPREPRLQALERRLRAEPPDDLVQRPPLLDLLQASIKPGYPVVFSLQRHNRTYPGLAVVRGADGRFVRKPDGNVFALAQLALAKSHLPGTITNGNTPQGLFVVKGTVAATNVWIGPTPALQSKLPTEATVAEFAHDESVAAEWDESRYWSYLPPSWQGYAPLREAWLAGLAGRDEMWLHGDTVNPHYYRNASYFPYAPSAGCMVAIEYWSQADGTLLQSDQLALVKAFASSGTLRGYLVVVELDDRQQPVALADILHDLLAAEAR